MVIAGGEGLEVVKAVDGERIFRGIVADGSCISADLALGDIV